MWLFSVIRSSSSAGIDPSVVEMHLRRMPDPYVERYAPADIARAPALLSRLTDDETVVVEVRPLGGQAHEIIAAGHDRTGVLALLTTALAAEGFDLQDVQISTYLPAEEGSAAEEPTYFVDVFRVGCRGRGPSVAARSAALQERLRSAFRRLTAGDLRPPRRRPPTAAEPTTRRTAPRRGPRPCGKGWCWGAISPWNPPWPAAA